VDNGAHLHLLVNHFPIIGAFLAVPMLVLTLLLRKERGLLLASVLLLVVTAASGWASQWTGEKAETMFDNNENKEWYEPFAEADVEAHSDRAETAMYVAVPTGLLGIAVLVMAHRRAADNPLPRIWIVLLLAGAAATSGAMAWVGNAGGVIMHREIRGDSLDTTVKKTDAKEHESEDHPK
jgi:hypothetical protein